MKNVDFYFDIVSPFSYVANVRLKRMAKEQGFNIRYCPVLLGGIFKATENRSPIETPLKAKYIFDDLTRWATHYAVPMQMNPYFPLNSMSVMRMLVAIEMYHPEYFEKAVQASFNAMFRVPKNLADLEEVKVLIADLGLDVEHIMALIQQDDVKQKLIANTQAAAERGVFGVPMFFVGDEMFFGQDRLDFVERALQ
jgi:2-hydroxychromene-2-carboxylate isomerase